MSCGCAIAIASLHTVYKLNGVKYHVVARDTTSIVSNIASTLTGQASVIRRLHFCTGKYFSLLLQIDSLFDHSVKTAIVYGLKRKSLGLADFVNELLTFLLISSVIYLLVVLPMSALEKRIWKVRRQTPSHRKLLACFFACVCVA